MCVVSMVMDYYRNDWRKYLEPPLGPRELTPEEQERMQQQFQDLLDRAKKYDKWNNEPDCELDEKRKALKKIADELGIKITFA